MVQGCKWIGAMQCRQRSKTWRVEVGWIQNLALSPCKPAQNGAEPSPQTNLHQFRTGDRGMPRTQREVGDLGIQMFKSTE